MSQPTRAEFQRLLASGELFEEYARMQQELAGHAVARQVWEDRVEALKRRLEMEIERCDRAEVALATIRAALL